MKTIEQIATEQAEEIQRLSVNLVDANLPSVEHVQAIHQLRIALTNLVNAADVYIVERDVAWATVASKSLKSELDCAKAILNPQTEKEQ